MVSHPLDQGSFGTVYECIDLNKPNSMYVIKVSDNYQMLGREIEALKDIKSKETKLNMQYPYDYIPVIVSKGMFILEKPSQDLLAMPNSTDFDDNSELQMSEDKKFLSFYVMPKYGNNLEQLFN